MADSIGFLAKENPAISSNVKTSSVRKNDVEKSINKKTAFADVKNIVYLRNGTSTKPSLKKSLVFDKLKPYEKPEKKLVNEFTSVVNQKTIISQPTVTNNNLEIESDILPLPESKMFATENLGEETSDYEDDDCPICCNDGSKDNSWSDFKYEKYSDEDVRNICFFNPFPSDDQSEEQSIDDWFKKYYTSSSPPRSMENFSLPPFLPEFKLSDSFYCIDDHDLILPVNDD